MGVAVIVTPTKNQCPTTRTNVFGVSNTLIARCDVMIICRCANCGHNFVYTQGVFEWHLEKCEKALRGDNEPTSMYSAMCDDMNKQAKKLRGEKK